MKKLLFVLMVVAMASFLLVGCLPGLTPDPEPEPEPDPDPTVQAATITVDGEYYDASKGLTYVQAGSKLVTVTFELPIEEEFGVQINGVPATVKAGSDRKIWTLLVDFSLSPYEVVCIEQCITVTVGHPCCPEDADTYWKLVVPDGEAPCASFTLTFEDCGDCLDIFGVSMSWTTSCEDECDVPADCCGDDCSGVGDWSFVLDYDECDGPCDTETGNDCAIAGAFECGCLFYSGQGDPATTGTHEVLVSIKDNVGNEFKDTWVVIIDTDEVVSVDGEAVTWDAVNEVWTVKLDFDCTWDGCDDCFPSED